jgi:sec-independent protein translocase protein TatB
MFGFSIGEVLVLAVIALIVIGPKQLPEFARQIGRLLNEIKRSTSDFAEEMKQQTRIDLDLEDKPAKPPEPKKDETT